MPGSNVSYISDKGHAENTVSENLTNLRGSDVKTTQVGFRSHSLRRGSSVNKLRKVVEQNEDVDFRLRVQGVYLLKCTRPSPSPAPVAADLRALHFAAGRLRPPRSRARASDALMSTYSGRAGHRNRCCWG